jgi:predicted transcriptional regulator
MALGVRADPRDTLRMTVRTTTRARTPTADWTYEPRPAPSKIPVNLSLPEDLVRELDQVAGRRKRSAFTEEALRRAIKRERFRIAGEKYAGSLKADEYPHWRTSEDVVAWVRMMRVEETDHGDEHE